MTSVTAAAPTVSGPTDTSVPQRPTSRPMLTVSALARASGITPSAVRFYEKHGLITGERTSGNQRRFHQVNACLIKIIRVAQRVGLSVAEIRELMADLPADDRGITVDDFLRLRRRLEQEARTRLQALMDVLDDLGSEQRLCEVSPAKPSRPHRSSPSARHDSSARGGERG